MCKRLTVDANGKHGDEAGFDKDNVAIYGASMSIDAWYTYVPGGAGRGRHVCRRRPVAARR